MSPSLVKITLVLLFMSIIIPQKSVGEYEQWCIADEQTPDEELKVALDWACGEGGADCSKIQVQAQRRILQLQRSCHDYRTRSKL
ncbi:hypothetical protein V6Z11_A07G196000 [Gossypium hirsutum]|uniref:X8 domain-containing protein n=1 Tax=Gossypium tomentosum TaxID=34277 RepID=A0A5D2PVG2_GOSTO|nr:PLASMODESMATA CALLOSE-BINDING PROTEIN 5 isoform X2 [Gossypium arboreum]TYI19893.1 hypothetical protein ES332_A07G196800v1 [Gossypium tomentosum]